MTEPQPLSAGFADLMRRFPPEHRLHQAAAQVVNAGAECADRRGRVLKHDDLAAKLTRQPLSYTNAGQWNGWVPPRLIDPGDQGESLLTPILHHGGSVRYRFNQLGKRTVGEEINDSPRRAALVDIAVEARRREREASTP